MMPRNTPVKRLSVLEAPDPNPYYLQQDGFSVDDEQMKNMSGDPTAHALYSRLFRAFEAPYMAMIKSWTTHGRLVDPYDEFCVKVAKFINRGTLEVDFMDEFWERYTVSVLAYFVTELNK